MSLFQKHIEPRCAYCTRCRPLNEEQVVCEKKGVMRNPEKNQPKPPGAPRRNEQSP